MSIAYAGKFNPWLVFMFLLLAALTACLLYAGPGPGIPQLVIACTILLVSLAVIELSLENMFRVAK